MNNTIKSIDTCNKTIKLNKFGSTYNITIQVEEEIQKIIPAPDLKMALDLFDEVQMQLYRNFN